MNQKAVDWVNEAKGWSLGSGPSLVVVEQRRGRAPQIRSIASKNQGHCFWPMLAATGTLLTLHGFD